MTTRSNTHISYFLTILLLALVAGCNFLQEGVPAPDDDTVDDDDTTPPDDDGNCADGIDNDGDGWTDGADVECITGTVEIGVSVGECDDHIDNDGDNLIDAADPVCTVSWFPYEELPTPPGDDDDSVGICDDPMTIVYAAFACLPGSLESLECTEDTVTVTCLPPMGGDTIINNVDNSVVYQWIDSFNETTTGDDDDSAGEPPPLPYEGDDSGECSDGADNDIDGLFDCVDPGCFGSPDCAPDGDDDDAADDDDTTGDDDDATPPPPYEGDEPGECDDGADNDIDGLFDCTDPGCYGAPICADGDDDDSTAGDDDDSTGDDDDDSTPPATTECTDGVDNNGDGLIDSADPGCDPTLGWRRDWDGDGFPNISGTSTGDVVFQESDPSGTWDYYLDGSVPGDCADSIDTVYPGGPEYCDGLDGDCNGVIDDADWDGDGWIAWNCSAYTGPLPGGDCQDMPGTTGPWQNADIHPGMLEMGDWVDSDCDGVADDGCVWGCTSGYELDGDPAIECFDGFAVAARFGGANPFWPGSWTYDSSLSGHGTGGVYAAWNVTCEVIDQADPANGLPLGDRTTPGTIWWIIESRN